MLRFTAILVVVVASLLSLASPAFADEVIELEGDVPDDGLDHFFLPFSVPAGTAEIQIDHDDLSEENILDWGVEDPSGFRGWGGGNSEPAIIGVAAASRSYVAGPLVAGQWRVVVGKAKVVEQPARYKVTVTLRDVATLPPQTERKPYVDPGILVDAPGWYAGDFHVHSIESGDARPPLDEVATFAAGRKLDFALISDHNTLTQLEFLVEAQKRHPKFLFLPGMEFTTYAGHANAIGATAWVDHKIGQPGVTIAGAASAFRDQGALFSINHPILEIGDYCIGCAWNHVLPIEAVDAVEIQTGSPSAIGILFPDEAIEYWDALCDQGHHIAAIGGSDDHKAGVDLGPFQSPIGEPTTLVYAENLSVAGILEGIRASRTVIKLWSPDEPMIELSSSVPPEGDTVRAKSAILVARVSGGVGNFVRFMRDGKPEPAVEVTSDPFEHDLTVEAPAEGEARYRVEVLDANDKRRTLTGHVWIQKPAASSADTVEEGGCGCRVSGPGSRAWLFGTLTGLVALGFTFWRRRRAK